MKPFSAFKYFAQNKKKGIMTFVVLTFTVLAIAIITVLVDSALNTVSDVLLKSFNEYSVITKAQDQNYLETTIVNKLKSDPNIEKLVSGDIANTDMDLAFDGDTSVPVLFMSRSSDEYFLQQLNDHLRTGRLPDDSTNEIAVDWRVMANKGWKIGEVVGSDENSNEALIGSYKIVGELEGPDIAVVGTQSTRQSLMLHSGILSSNPVTLIVFPKAGKLSVVNTTLDNLSNNKTASGYTYTMLKNKLEKTVDSSRPTVYGILLIVGLILGLSVAALMYLIYQQRSEEFGILTAIGYRRSFIGKLILKEIFSLDLISWATGIILAFVVVELLNIMIYYPKGNVLSMIDPTVFRNTIFIPIIVAIFSVLPILFKLSRQDPITIIERRD